jgi:uncharacterized protein
MKKQQIFYIHGGSSYSKYEDYLKTLRSTELRNLPGTTAFRKWAGALSEDLGEDYEVFTPSMPNSDNAKYEEWKIWFERHFEHLRNDIILIGWSLGGMFLIKYLTENEFPYQIRALFLIASPAMPFLEEPEDCAEFAFSLEATVSLFEKCEKIYLFHSKDDFVVPFEHGEALSKKLPEAEFITFEDKNHFLIEEFPELVGKIRSLAG